MTKQRGSIMSAIFDLLYREYCRARLAEMRKQLLLRHESEEIPEAIWDADYRAADAGSRSGDSQHEPSHAGSD
jgi:hypothetical protein